MIVLKFILAVVVSVIMGTYGRRLAYKFQDRFDAGYWTGFFIAFVFMLIFL